MSSAALCSTGLTVALLPRQFGVRAVAATTIEAAWEAYENADQVISRYRTETISLGYYGDSIINSVADMLACVAGFFSRAAPSDAGHRLLGRWPPSCSSAFWIHDNLTLNILMLIHPVRRDQAMADGCL